jgi:hypothetical protein
MSHYATCHLSSLLITNDEAVILLPMAYSHMRSTHTSCYGSDSDCKPFGLPLQGQYDDYGSMKLSPISESVGKSWLETINTSYKNNPENITKSWQNMTLRNLYIFKRDEFNEPQHGGFISDNSALLMSETREGLYEKHTIDSMKNLFSILYDGALLDISHFEVNRMGFLLIKQAIFDAIVADFYAEVPARVKLKLVNYYQQALDAKAHFNTLDPKALSEDRKAEDRIAFRLADKATEINEHKLSSDILELFNDNQALIQDLVSTLQAGIERGDSTDDMAPLFDHCVQWSLIMRIYRENGKSLFPNTTRVSNMAPLAALNRVVSQAIETNRQNNISNIKSDNSYEDLSPEEQKEIDVDIVDDQWSDHRKW